MLAINKNSNRQLKLQIKKLKEKNSELSDLVFKWIKKDIVKQYRRR